MDKRIVYTRPDGGVSVVVPSGAAKLADVLKRDVPADALDVAFVDAASVPADRSFRDAWRHTKGAISIHMPRAREIHMARIRLARDAELRRLDVEQLKGVDVAARKQSMRDLPQTLASVVAGVATPAELMAVWPADLAP